MLSCISSFSYIKPQRDVVAYCIEKGCISSFSYIKPQLCACYHLFLYVVYHPFPTSNHNLGRILACISGTYASLGA